MELVDLRQRIQKRMAVVTGSGGPEVLYPRRRDKTPTTFSAEAAPARILLVDDSDEDAAAFERSFAESGLAVEIARSPNGEAALSRLFSGGNTGFDLGFVDQNLPGMNGLSFCREVLAAGFDLPLVFLAAAGSETVAMAVAAFKAGACDYVVKDLHQGYPDRLPSIAREALHRLAIRRTRGELSLSLKKTNDELEERVRQRTADFQSANQRLLTESQDRLPVQEEVDRGRKMLQAVFDGISDPLILFNEDMTIRMINAAAARYYGVDGNSAAEGKSARQLVVIRENCKDCRIPEAVRAGKRITYERKGVIAPERLERVVVYPLPEAGKGVGSAVVHIADVTEARLTEKQMIQSEKMASLGMLVSSIAHEINNPNNFVTFNIPILKDYLREILPLADAHAAMHPGLELCHLPYPEFRRDIQRLVENIGHGAERISAFVRNLREFSQFKGHLSRGWIDPARPAARALAICNSKLKSCARTVIREIPDDLPKIYSDSCALEQVLINLLVNAAQACDKKDAWVKLKIAVTETWSEKTIIEVSDNGKGMDAETRKKIFNPFFTTKSSAEGTGLGLYVCRCLVNGLDGRLEVESEPGKGSKFTIFLPDRERRAEPRLPASRSTL